MKFYCREEKCKHKIKGCTYCTALEKIEDCPKQKKISNSDIGKVLMVGHGRKHE